MQSYLWLGDEALAQAAIDAGLSGVFAYPGTPSTEITEYIQKSKLAAERGIHSKWSCNEKTAMEEAIGMSFAGKRAMVCMKHVGLNVAADAFINSAITGANGGLVVASADDPSMHSSQNEQDSRFYGQFAQIPYFEPSSQQEAYDLTLQAFDVSERHGVPVLIRLTTRMAHSRANVIRRVETPRDQNSLHLPADPRQFVLLPAIARRNYSRLLQKAPLFEQESEVSEFNQYVEGPDRRMGILACGIAINYIQEVYGEKGCPHSLLKIGRYPIPRKLVNRLVESCESVMVFEDGYPMVEELVRGLTSKGPHVRGRLDGTLPRDGELSPTCVAKALGFPAPETAKVPAEVVGRPPSMCRGCPHANTFEFIVEAVKSFPQARVFSDIGCYTLGALPPYEAINSCVDMGASITMAKGASDAGLHPSLAVIGDSTFAHSGLTGLLDVVSEKSPVTIVIGDNLITGMTGGQPSAAYQRLEQLVLGIGVEPQHLHVVVPLPVNHEVNVELLKKEMEYPGPSVIIARRACVRAAV
ncbi:MAG TPA: indolepyruvate ferredoxin oxidoreductase [Verrucomicrobia bacterium]|nr:indolepyruvate ferredoxin oxidoreductase [Verrucomicrobiota bacterium]